VRVFVRAGCGGHAPFLLCSELLSRALLRGISTSTLHGGVCNISASSEFFEDISKVMLE
jgi:hypothetical protein